MVCCLLVVVSFAMFARDQAAGASEHQQTELVAGGANPTSAPAAITHKHSQPRRSIDEAAKVLMSPFSAVVKSSNPWVDHGLPAVLALLAYGVGLGYLARFASVRVH